MLSIQWIALIDHAIVWHPQTASGEVAVLSLTIFSLIKNDAPAFPQLGFECGTAAHWHTRLRWPDSAQCTLVLRSNLNWCSRWREGREVGVSNLESGYRTMMKLLISFLEEEWDLKSLHRLGYDLRFCGQEAHGWESFHRARLLYYLGAGDGRLQRQDGAGRLLRWRCSDLELRRESGIRSHTACTSGCSTGAHCSAETTQCPCSGVGVRWWGRLPCDWCEL